MHLGGFITRVYIYFSVIVPHDNWSTKQVRKKVVADKHDYNTVKQNCTNAFM